MTSNANDLTERLRRRLETERQAIEELTASELERLGANSRRVASNALRTIERDTAVATGRIETAAALDLGIEEARQTLARLEAATWGITLQEIEGERFVVLPAGSLAYPPLTVGTRPAVKLSNE